MSARILIVDDEPAIAFFLQRYLCAMRPGDTVHTCASAAAAFGELERAEYDLVIVDYLLPDATGFSVLDRARQQTPPAQGILMTGMLNSTLEHAARQAGVAWLSKPFDLQTMRRLVAACLDHTPAPLASTSRPDEPPTSVAAA